MIMRSLFLLIACGSLTMSTHAQTADEILAKSFQAIGGEKAVNSTSSAVIQSELSAMGNAMQSTISILYGKAFKSVMSFNGVEIVQCVTPEGGWMLNPLAGQDAPQDMSPEQVKSAQVSYELGGPLTHYKKMGYKAELLGREMVDGANTYKIKMTKEGEPTMTVFIHPDTYYMVRMDVDTEVNGQAMTISTNFSDFRKSDSGFTMPYVISTSNMGIPITITYKKVEFNKPIDAKEFQKPAGK